MIESHSEQKIVECCIDLMQELVNEFEKYIDYMTFYNEAMMTYGNYCPQCGARMIHTTK